MIEREFSQEDQLGFAQLSGDWNPIHVDPVEARRTPYGQLVHGVHVVMWALEQHFSAASVVAPARLQVTFLQPVHLHTMVTLSTERTGDDTEMTVRARGRTLISIRLQGSTVLVAREDVRDEPIPRAEPAALAFAEARGRTATSVLRADRHALTAAFPNVVRALGATRAAAMLALSRLVGMDCPGLHSVFVGIDIALDAASSKDLNYRVARHLSPAAPIRMAVSGGGIDGTVDAIFRPAPVRQLTSDEARGRVEAAEFEGVTALIVGGSRGLGETSAKLVAAGGGRVILTYHVGKSAAAHVANEISAGGGDCRAISLDVLGALEDLRALFSAERITHVLYFASPAIRANRAADFDRGLFDTYASYYVEAFARVCRAVPDGQATQVFYPSTVFLAEPPPGFQEYVAAKAAGEAVAAGFGHARPSLSFVVERLPRARTDQTSSLLDQGGAAAHDVLLPILRRMSGFKEKA